MTTAADAPRRRGGPKRMDPETVRAFLAVPRWVSVCVEDDDGELVAAPASLVAARGGELELAFPGRDATLPAGPAAISADEFESYEGIVGVIVRGALVDRSHFTVEHAAGFTFAGTMPPRDSP